MQKRVPKVFIFAELRCFSHGLNAYETYKMCIGLTTWMYADPFQKRGARTKCIMQYFADY